MEKEIPQIIDVAKKTYDSFVERLTNLYNDYSKLISFNFSLIETLESIDETMQSILLKVAVADKKIVNSEINFIFRVQKFKDLFSNVDFKNSLSVLEANAIANKILDKVPTFALLTVLVDKYNDDHAIIISPTNCQYTYDFLKRLPNYIKFVDGEVVTVEDKTAKDALDNITNYYKKNYVKFAPSRKNND